jgi:hypothetical protein
LSTNTPPAAPDNGLKAKGRMPSILAGITLLVAASVDALGIYFYNWSGSSLIFVFVLGFIAYLIGLKIEGRSASQR